jgi:phosphatidylglycerophosphate synthase
MKLVKRAIILLPLCSGQNLALLQRNFAGIKMLERLILTLQRAGLENIIILSQGSVGDIRVKNEKAMAKDFRSKREIIWQEQTEGEDWKIWQHISRPNESQKILLVKGNLVVTAATIHDFIEQSNKQSVFGQDEIVGLEGPQIKRDNIFLCPLSKLSALKNYVENPKVQRLSNVVFLGSPKYFAKLLEDERSARQTERTFINTHKYCYHQFMDLWVNSYFSLKISSLLIKTSVTPNVITLLGIVIGLFSAWQFAQGDYWSGLLGGLAFAGTSIWDCCDGDVARLKFMESDFGDTLDTTCDNINNIFVFTGIMIGVAKHSGLFQALIPFVLLSIGGCLVFYFIYFPKGGKGSFYEGTWMYNVIQHLASRNFVYVVLLFGILGKMDWFLWLSGFGSSFFATALYISKRKLA